MAIIIIIVALVTAVSLYEFFSGRNWEQVTSETRNDIVFASRNQEYGAFVLRNNYNKRMSLILLGMVLSIGVAYATYMIVVNMPEEEIAPPKIDTSNLAIPAPPEEELPPPPKEIPPPPQERTIAFPPPVIVDIEVDEEVVLQEDLEKTKASTTTNEQEGDQWSTQTGPTEEKKEEEVEKKEEAILEFIEEDAEFPGGQAALQQWIVKNVRYPEVAMDNGDKGKVYVAFVVEKDGSISNVLVERGVTDELDAEARRLIRTMPRWKPGKNNGNLVRQRCRVPINFEIN